MIIQNQGEIDVNALLLLGASSKRGDESKIGHFGSGLKYALAVLIRNDIDIKIFSGITPIKIGTRKTKFRGIEFTKIIVNNRETGITTSLGEDWEVWQAIREIYCNAIDEGGHKIVGIGEPVLPAEGKTTFVLEPNGAGALILLQKINDNWNSYFTEKRTDKVLETNEWKVFQGMHNLCFYRKGIRCWDCNRESLYDYDVDQIEINESRIVKYTFMMYSQIARLWGSSATEDMIHNLLNHKNEDYFENILSWSDVSHFNENWLKVINGRKVIPDQISGYFMREQSEGGLVVDHALAQALKKSFKDRIKVLGPSDNTNTYTAVEHSIKHCEMIRKCLDFFDRAGMPIKYPIQVVVFGEEKVMGHAAEGTIYLSVKAIDAGMKYTLTTILEESLHMESGQDDETRGFQDHIINKLVTLLEDKIGVIV